METLTIPKALPSMNQLLDWKQVVYTNRRTPSRRGNKYNALKRQYEELIVWEIRAQKIRPVAKARFRFIWREERRNRDKDNIAAAGRKLILDALVAAGVLKNDGWAHVEGWSDEFVVDRKNPGVTVEIEDVGEAGA